MRKKLNKREVQKILRLSFKLDDLRNEIEENDVELQFGNGTASEQLGCAIAALDCILQEYD
jgi:hypothetical protein